MTPTLTVEEVDRLAAACDRVSRRYGDYVRLAALLGLRAGELTALQVGDTDLSTGVVTVRRAFSAGELQTPKSRCVRQVPVVGGLEPILARMTNVGALLTWCCSALWVVGCITRTSGRRSGGLSWSRIWGGRGCGSTISGRPRLCYGFGLRCR